MEFKTSVRAIVQAALAMIDAEAPRGAAWALLGASQRFEPSWVLDADCIALVSLGLRASLHPAIDCSVAVADHFRKLADEALFAITEGPSLLIPLQQLEDLNDARRKAWRALKSPPVLDDVSF